ncbi:IlvD/Edd family dehydratase [Burkholderia cenocepacia]|uniref:Dihydroxy-acid dehydratase family protein n=1 Tax=Burkholderia cenocepacia TaxID=95486 RepID=A0ABD4UPS1_9BURK|nr:IlvD/Edd family dehydratase [Burkholderia cenocepacia]MCW3698573.1 dihydroxy-acid dehydratase family protein [Burkholderia cenocepacia]MCW3708145.1 dihydroxy-acid dehydratase family protein [Burkholderia cenocepacia]MCW3716209.1 dihydroxy-acid dehydratase family protein [Burkholderia cenocepacia]MCW3724264.1 dihydroxy-acid dehydratase family protein [Burkholderia cenocepacia]MCW3732347.1 dihydroxy-acid dehydratase family protein [Burkholderia cenocepacia]
MTDTPAKTRRFRSRDWFDNPDFIDMTAIYLERFMNYGTTPEELRSGKPIIGIAQTGSDISPCNRIHVDLVRRVRDGIRDAGGIPMEFPTHPIFENCKRPTAALDRNLSYLSLVEVLFGYPIDAVVLTTGCDKTTPAALMAAATVDIPAIVLSGGPMLDGWHEGELVGSGTVIWRSRRKLAAGEINEEEFLEAALDSAPSLGHCNTMGTASTMNAIAEALGMSLTGCAAIPAPYRERGQMAYRTGHRIVEMAYEDLRPSQILTHSAFRNAIALTSAVGGSTNAHPHLMAIARHAGVEITHQDWSGHGHGVARLANVQPAGQYLSERFHRAGGVPAVMHELLHAGLLDVDCLTVTGKTIGENLAGRVSRDREVIAAYDAPFQTQAGMLVLSGNLFDYAIMKSSVISDEFRRRYLSDPSDPEAFEARAVVFDGAEDYHARINDSALDIDERCILVMRGAGPIGWPGAAEVVNMQPPDALIKRGVQSLPTLGDGRQSGTSDSPSILHASPESAAGGGLGKLRTGDRIRVDLRKRRCDVLVAPDEWARRPASAQPVAADQTPWQQLYRQTVGSLADGAVMEKSLAFRGIADKLPRHNH